MSFGKELKKKRTDAGLVLRDVVGETGVSLTSIWFYEADQRLLGMSVKHLLLISHFFAWPPEEMLALIERK